MIRIPRYVWIDLRLDDEERRDLAGRRFYLGHGVELTRRVLDGFLSDEETVRALHIACREIINKTDEVLNAGNNVSTC